VLVAILEPRCSIFTFFFRRATTTHPYLFWKSPIVLPERLNVLGCCDGYLDVVLYYLNFLNSKYYTPFDLAQHCRQTPTIYPYNANASSMKRWCRNQHCVVNEKK
jgi:hypothetical protein